MRYELGHANRLGNRANNQDRLCAIEKHEGVLLVLADGMGGRPGGELAAQLLIEYAEKEYLSRRGYTKNPQTMLAHIIHQAHAAINELAWNFDPPLSPGTTGVLCLLEKGEAHWAHVGDSRLYLFRDGLALYRTVDHSYVEELYQQGLITREEQDSHPQRNQITQCIGCHPAAPRISLGKQVVLKEGDILLLCSDGFWGPLDDSTIGTGLRNETLPEALDAIAERAERIAHPASDNVSVLALRFLSKFGVPAPKRRQEPASCPSAGTDTSDNIREAIDQLERVLKEYEDEFKG